MTSRPDDNLTSSLIPEIWQKEEHLLAELEKARSEVEHLKSQAERTADERLSEARNKLPALVDHIQQQGVSDVRAAIQKEQLAGRDEIAHLESIAQHNLPDAVSHILSVVLPRNDS